MRLNINAITFIGASVLGMLGSMVSCTDDILDSTTSTDVPIDTEGAIVFGRYLSGTKAWVRDDALIAQYSASDVNRDFQVEMFKNVGGTATKVGKTRCYSTSSSFPSDGTLTAKDTALYWPDNVTAYAFKATAGEEDVLEDQSTKQNFDLSDYIIGYGYEALKENDNPVDNIDNYNYHTSKEWYSMNAVSYGSGGSTATQKIVPLFMKRQHSRISIILKAGKGVPRSALAFSHAGTTIKDTIFSYSGGVAKAILPYATEEFIHYDADDNGPAQDSVSTTRFDAIVEPYTYLDNSEDIITRINLSDLKYSFFSRNDSRYTNPGKASEMQCYNIGPGQQLVITIRLESGSHIMVLSAQVQEWSDKVTYGVADDFGQNGDPIIISDRDELIDYLTDPQKNKAGQVALVAAAEIDLETWDSSSYTLNGTLNLAGAKIITDSQFLNSINKKGNLLNGKFVMKDSSSVKSAICETNNGIINSITVNNSENNLALATVAGIAEINHNKIYNSKSYLPVKGTSGYVGGIAGESTGDGGSAPMIDGCEVLCSVKGDAGCTGGGIVGKAEGNVTNNKNSYGVTISQSSDFLNIVGASAGILNAHDNGWTTNDDNAIAGTNITAEKVDGIIDCQEDLEGSYVAKYNAIGKICSVMNGFSVDGDSWTGDVNDVKYKLNGNSHTIVLTGATQAKRLFGNIYADMSDLIIDVNKPLAENPVSNATATAGFAYSVCNGAVISNIKVKTTDSAYIEAANPAGVIVWAYDGAIVESCQFKGDIRVRLAMDLSDGQCYCGGIVSMVADAKVSRCVCHTSTPFSRSDSFLDSSKNIFYGGIVGGTYFRNNVYVPNLLLTDCSSNYSFLEENKIQCGSIIGYAKYYDPAEKNGLASGCQGNWWMNGQNAISTKGLCTGISEKSAIGKCNAIKPTLDSDW